jgi:hypothetical protein
MKLHDLLARKEGEDIKAETEGGVELPPEKGLKWYWKNKNTASIDELPGLQSAFCSTTIFDEKVVKRDWGTDDERLLTEFKFGRRGWLDARTVVGFVMGVVVSALWLHFGSSSAVKG